MKQPPIALADFVKKIPDNIRDHVCGTAMIYGCIEFDMGNHDAYGQFLNVLSEDNRDLVEACILLCGVMDYILLKKRGGAGLKLEEAAIAMGSDTLGKLSKEQPAIDSSFALAKASWQILRQNDLSIESLQQFEEQRMAKR